MLAAPFHLGHHIVHALFPGVAGAFQLGGGGGEVHRLVADQHHRSEVPHQQEVHVGARPSDRSVPEVDFGRLGGVVLVQHLVAVLHVDVAVADAVVVVVEKRMRQVGGVPGTEGHILVGPGPGHRGLVGRADHHVGRIEEVDVVRQIAHAVQEILPGGGALLPDLLERQLLILLAVQETVAGGQGKEGRQGNQGIFRMFHISARIRSWRSGPRRRSGCSGRRHPGRHPAPDPRA